MTTDEVLCRWAEQKYELPTGSVERVRVEIDYDPGWSEYTPGEGLVQRIYVYSVGDTSVCTCEQCVKKDPTRLTRRRPFQDFYRDVNSVELIHEVCNFALQCPPA